MSNLLNGLPPVGSSCRSSGRTISEGEHMLLHNIFGAMTPLHVNKHYMSTQPYGERLFGGSLLVGMMGAGWATSDIYRRLVSDHGVRWTAALGMEARFEKPFFPGNTLYMEHSIDDVRESKSRPGYGVMKVGMTAENEHGDVCSRGILTAMFDRPDLTA